MLRDITHKTNNNKPYQDHILKHNNSLHTLQVTTAKSQLRRTISKDEWSLFIQLIYNTSPNLDCRDCKTLLTLGTTCKTVYSIVNHYLKTYIETRLKDPLVNNIFSSNANLQIDAFPEIEDNFLIQNYPNYCTKYRILFFLSSQYKSNSELCKNLQNTFYDWNFHNPIDSENKNTTFRIDNTNVFLIHLLSEIIKNDLSTNSHTLCIIIKKFIIGYLYLSKEDFPTTIYYLDDLLEKLFNNTIPYKNVRTHYTKNGCKTILNINRLVKRTLFINEECIKWIITTCNYCLANPDSEIQKKADKILYLLTHNNLMSSPKKNPNWIQNRYNKFTSSWT